MGERNKLAALLAGSAPHNASSLTPEIRLIPGP